MRFGPFEAVRGIDFDVHHGEIFAILGPNGAGKTTTIEILEGFQRRTGGAVRVLDEDPEHAGGRWRSRIGVVLQESQPEAELTVAECVSLYAGYYPHPRAVADTLELVGLSEKAGSRSADLSGGQRRRLDVALALIGDPELIFLDEPTTGFDPAARRSSWDVIAGLRALGKTVVLTTHYMDEAEHLADQVHVIDRGRLIASGSPFELTRASGSTTIRLVVTEPFPPEAPGSLQATLGGGTTVQPVNTHSLLITGPADASTLAKVSAWCDEQGVLPESLALGQRTLEDVFLQITGRELVP
jgi:ABC-2 type transport system ATP-binding protein